MAFWENHFLNMKNTSALDWNDLKYFLAVARGGGLTPAAVELHASPSTVSRHIDAMEARLGARLFLRQQRGYQLTDQGSTLFEHVAEVELAMQAVERNGGLLGSADEAVGLVRLATTEMLANYLIAPHLGAFANKHPRAQVELIASRNLADLSRREADLALRIASPQGQSHNPDYIAHRLGELPFALYCTAGLMQQAEGGDWRNLPYVTWDAAHATHGPWLATLFPDREPLLRSNSLQVQYVTARCGLGIALLPCFIADADAALQRLNAEETPAERHLWLVYHRDLKSSRRVLAMRDFVQELVQRYVLVPV